MAATGHRTAAHARRESLQTRSVELQRSEATFVFLLSAEERETLIRALRVIEDNWWLDDRERALLDRLDGTDVVSAPAA